MSDDFERSLLEGPRTYTPKKPGEEIKKLREENEQLKEALAMVLDVFPQVNGSEKTSDALTVARIALKTNQGGE